MTERRWFYELLAEEFGPVSLQEIDNLMADGTLGETDRIRSEDSPEWQTLGDLLSSDSANSEVTADGIEDLSELSFTFEENTDSAETATALGDPDIDSFQFEDNADTPDIDSFQFEDDSAARLMDSMRVEGDVDSPQPASSHSRHQPVPESGSDPADDAHFYVSSLGQELGPMPLEELLQMVASGVLSSSDQIRDGHTSTWVSADSQPDVAALLSRIEQAAEPQPESAPGDTEPAAKQPVTATQEDSDSNDAASTTGSGKPPETGQSTQKKRGNRQKKRKRKKEDVLLKEIFSEVFTEDGSVRPDEERPDLRNPAAVQSAAVNANAAPTQQAMEASAPVTDSAAAATPAPAAVPPPMIPQPGAGFASSSGMGQPAAAAHARPPFKPARKKSKGLNLGALEPKVLGIVGAGMAVVLLIGGFVSGMISLPGTGNFVPSEATLILQQMASEYQRLSGGDISDTQWEEFQTKAKKAVADVNAKFLAKTDLSAAEYSLKKACFFMNALASAKRVDEGARSRSFQAFENAMNEL